MMGFVIGIAVGMMLGWVIGYLIHHPERRAEIVALFKKKPDA